MKNIHLPLFSFRTVLEILSRLILSELIDEVTQRKSQLKAPPCLNHRWLQRCVETYLWCIFNLSGGHHNHTFWILWRLEHFVIVAKCKEDSKALTYSSSAGTNMRGKVSIRPAKASFPSLFPCEMDPVHPALPQPSCPSHSARWWNTPKMLDRSKRVVGLFDSYRTLPLVRPNWHCQPVSVVKQGGEIP